MQLSAFHRSGKRSAPLHGEIIYQNLGRGEKEGVPTTARVRVGTARHKEDIVPGGPRGRTAQLIFYRNPLNQEKEMGNRDRQKGSLTGCPLNLHDLAGMD